MVRVLWVLPWLLAATLLGAVPAALAHLGRSASIIVPLNHINPGEAFPVIAADLGPSASVEFSLLRGDGSPAVSLGSATAGSDGHFDSTLTLPANFPNGYVELVATSDAGVTASAWIRVGTLTTTPALWQDPAVILLGGLIVAGLAVGALAVLRRSRPPVRQPQKLKRSR